jgi:hypothetical protein
MRGQFGIQDMAGFLAGLHIHQRLACCFGAFFNSL